MSSSSSSPSSPSSSISSDEISNNRSLWRWRWRSVPISVIGEDIHSNQSSIPSNLSSSSSSSIIHSSTIHSREDKPPIEEKEHTGWERITQLYTKPSMERDIIERVARMSFFGGFVIGGSNGYLLAKQQYESANKGRKYLSPSDAIKRRIDYAIVRFAMSGFSVGLKAAFISGSIVLLSTHTASIRRHFSSLYFPAYSGPIALLLHTAIVGGVFAFPTGLIGSAKAFGLGITSGLTLSAVCGLYALSTDRSIDSAYWHLKKEYEAALREEGTFERRINEVIKERNCWRYEAVKIVKEEEENKLTKLDT